MERVLRRIAAVLTVAAFATPAFAAVACEKNNDIVVQDQLRDSASACDKGCEEHVPGCDIKGNISTGGNKFYHVPGSLNYDGKIVQPEKGERWFCTEEQAQKNGFVRKDT